ncbi:MAG: hypothetical protein ACOYL8_04975 [Patescibacteria group bacterium]
MKKKLFILALSVFLFSLTAIAQSSETDSLKKATIKTEISSDSLQKLSLEKVCNVLGINYDYNLRYHKIILPLCENGIILFDKYSNPYTADLKDDPYEKPWYFYAGTFKQNEKLKRNLIANRALIEKGTIPQKNMRQWKTVK